MATKLEDILEFLEIEEGDECVVYTDMEEGIVKVLFKGTAKESVDFLNETTEGFGGSLGITSIQEFSASMETRIDH